MKKPEQNQRYHTSLTFCQKLKHQIRCRITSSNLRKNLKREFFSIATLAFLSMAFVQQVVDVFTFAFFLTSPLTSYGDQIFAMHRRKSSTGFSIDVCGIMLVARYSPSLPDNWTVVAGELWSLWVGADFIVY